MIFWLVRRSIYLWVLTIKGTPFSRDLLWVFLNNDAERLRFLIHKCQRRKSFMRLMEEHNLFHGA